MNTYEQELETLINTAAVDYADYCMRTPYHDEKDYDDLLETFTRTMEVVSGRKYDKIVTSHLGQRSVWGFVVKKDGGKFKCGDILKPAGWNAPATNQARGNIFEDDYEVNWTGPLYL